MDTYALAQRRLLAKMISELSWEELLDPTGGPQFELILASGATYRFEAVRRIWDNLDIDAASIRVAGGGTPCPLSFVIDARDELGMTPATEAMFLRELSNTLQQDQQMLSESRHLTAAELIQLPIPALHAQLNGHPKAVANKGRLGWGVDDLTRYAPENMAPIQLFWIAADRTMLRIGGSIDFDADDALDAALGDHAKTLRQTAASKGVADTHVLIPLHPWQWTHTIQQSFVGEIASGRIVPLGLHGPDFTATPSLRTLTPVGGGAFDIKLSLGILNTSAWRGMPGKYIAHGGAISDWLEGVVANDPVLSPRVTVLKEVAGYWYAHPQFQANPEAPYRHHEMLGAIWRQNAEHLAGSDRQAVMAAALFHEDAVGCPLALAWAEQSGLCIQDWLSKLFEVTVLPLWHFLCQYGVGFIAHGQNVTVILDKGVPVGLAIKDFQGDLDLVDQNFDQMSGLDPAIRDLLPRKPPAYIVHDIQTAHFITVLRFLSAGLAGADAIEEGEFYQILAQVLHRYAEHHPALTDRFELFDLFAAKMPKVCINRVRLAIGYDDSAQRPLPVRGRDLYNPLSDPEVVSHLKPVFCEG